MNKNVTMAQLFQRFDRVCSTVETIEFISDAMKRTSSNMESVSFVADDNTIIVGETYNIQSSGIYKIQGNGTGEFSYTIKEPTNLTVVYEGNHSNSETTDELYLTHGDICYIHASQVTGTGDYTVTIQQTQTLYEFMTSHLAELERGYNLTDMRVATLIQQYDTILWENREYEPFEYVRNDAGKSYVSIKAVPKDVELGDEEYWCDLHTYIVELAFIHNTLEKLKADVEEAGKGSVSFVDEDYGEDEEWIESTDEENTNTTETENVEESEV